MLQCCTCRLFRQPLVPVIGTEDGRWVLPKPMAPMLKPGGHGAIWKLMLDEASLAGSLTMIAKLP